MIVAALLLAAAAAVMLTIAAVAGVLDLAWAALATALVAGVLLAVGVVQKRPRRGVVVQPASTWSGSGENAAGTLPRTDRPTIRVIHGPAVVHDDGGDAGTIATADDAADVAADEVHDVSVDDRFDGGEDVQPGEQRGV